MIEEVTEQQRIPYTVEPCENGVVVVPGYGVAGWNPREHCKGMRVFNSHADFCAWAKDAFVWSDSREYIYLEPLQIIQTAHSGTEAYEVHHSDGSRTIYRRTDRKFSGMPVFA